MHRTFLISLLFLFIACGNEPPPSSRPIAEQNEDTLKKIFEDNIPTAPPPDFDTSQWTELTRLDPGILLDLRYATTNNFVNEKMYGCARCFLRPDAAIAIIAAHRKLQEQGLGLKLFDCYRPRSVQWILWEKVPNPNYVADPRKGSSHNRGTAVDLTIVDNKGIELDMGTAYDFFGSEAHHNYKSLPEEVLKNRNLLMTTMKKHGFRPTPTEWWHYSLISGKYSLSDWVWNCPE